MIYFGKTLKGYLDIGVSLYMGFDKLCLTVDKVVNNEFLNTFGDLQEDGSRVHLYKYFCKLDEAEVMWKPHRFSQITNYKIPYCKVDISPRYFNSFGSLYEYLSGLFLDRSIPLALFNVSRIDLKSDIEDLPIDVVLSRLWAMGFKRDSVNIYKGQTIYIGSNPKIRIYNKTEEIKARHKKGKVLTDWERNIIESKKQLTRFEIQVRYPKKTLQDVADNPEGFISYFDRLRFYNFEDDGE